MSNNIKLLLISLVLFSIGGFLIYFGVNNSRVKIPETEEIQETSPRVISETEDPVLQEFLVTKVIDGDTIEVEGGYRIRYIGIDTPETVDPRRPVGCFGKEAKEENEKLVSDREVILEKDISETDKFGRLLRYVYIKEGDELILVNEMLLRGGFGKASSYPPDIKFTEKFLEYEREARSYSRGLWGSCKTTT